MKPNGLFTALILMAWLLAACTNLQQAFTPTPAPTPTPKPISAGIPPTEALPRATPLSQVRSMEEQLAEIDAMLKQSAKASIAYNAPSEMHVDETVTIELLLNTKASEDELKKQISEPGTIHSSGDVQITPYMKAKLIPQDKNAFSVVARPDEEHAIQLISGTQTTKWSWNVTAQKPGTQRLTISLSRLVKYADKETWMEVGEYNAEIVVQVTLLSQLEALDWKWLAAIAVVVIAISVFWRRGVRRRQGSRPKPRSTRAVGASPKAGQESGDLGRIFISYRRSDSADIAGRIYDCLVDRFGRDPIFKDVDSIPLGVDFKEYLDRKVRECKVLLAIIGDHWLDASDETGKKRLKDPADFVRIEIESALESGIPVIPLLVRDAKMPAAESLPPSLRKLVYKNGVEIRPDPDFHHDMDRLISALNKYVGS